MSINQVLKFMKSSILVLMLLSSIIVSCVKTECVKKDIGVEILKMRINHYQQPVNQFEFFYGMAFFVQIGEDIGNENWNSFPYIINGFDYELGYIYDIEVSKKHLELTIDGPNAEYSLFKIISMEEVSKNTTFDIILTIKYHNGFESLVKRDEYNNFSLLDNINIECGELCDDLDQGIENQIGLIGTFNHLNKNTIKLKNLKKFEN